MWPVLRSVPGADSTGQWPEALQVFGVSDSVSRRRAWLWQRFLDSVGALLPRGRRVAQMPALTFPAVSERSGVVVQVRCRGSMAASCCLTFAAVSAARRSIATASFCWVIRSLEKVFYQDLARVAIIREMLRDAGYGRLQIHCGAE